jgi:serine phosphatase RsbU (regulator of sigma subunit)
MADSEAGPALGLFPEAGSYAEVRRPVAADDLVMIFTDGLYEVERADGSFLEKETLRATVAELAARPTAELLDSLLARIKQASASGDFDDDMCVVGVDIASLHSP